MAMNTSLNEFEYRISNLDVAIGRMSAILDSMLPPRSQTPDHVTFRSPSYTGWPDVDSSNDFEREDVMSDISEEETVVYYNQYDFGDIDEDTDDITFVPPWEKPYLFDSFVTPPANQQSTDPPPLYRPSYLDLQIYEDDNDIL